LISSRGHPNFIFAKSRVLLVMNKMFCTSVLIENTFNVKIMLNMPRINIENMARAKIIISFGVLHRDVARVLILFIPQIIADNGRKF